MADKNKEIIHYRTPEGEDLPVPKGTPPEEVRKYLEGLGGFTKSEIDDILSKPLNYGPTMGEGAGDWLSSFFKSAKSPLSAIATGLGKGVGDVLQSAPFSDPEGSRPPTEELPTEEQVTGMLGKKVGGWHEPAGLGERMLEGGARMLPAAVAAPGAPEGTAVRALPRTASYLAKLFNYGAVPGAASELVGSGVEKLKEMAPEYVGDKTDKAARIATSVLAPFATRKIITPNTVSPTNLRTNRRIEAEMPGVQTPSQFTGNKRLGTNELNINPNLNEDQRTALNRAVTRAAGDESPTVSAGHEGSWIDRNKTRVSNQIENVARQSHIDPNTVGGPIAPRNPNYRGPQAPQVFNDLAEIQHQAKDTPIYRAKVLNLLRGMNKNWVPNPAHSQANVDDYHSALFGTPNPNWVKNGNAINGGGTKTLSGIDYNKLRSKFNAEARAPGVDPGFARHLRDITHVLDNGLENTLHVSGRADLVPQWQTARKDYRNFLVAADARAKGGATNVLTPEQISESAKNIRGDMPYMRGQTDFGWMEDVKDRLAPVKPGPPSRFGIPGHVLGLGAWGGAGLYGMSQGLGGMESFSHAISPLLAGEAAGNLAPQHWFQPLTNAVANHPLYKGWQKNQLVPWPESAPPTGGGAAQMLNSALPGVASQPQQTNAAILRALMEGDHKREPLRIEIHPDSPQQQEGP